MTEPVRLGMVGGGPGAMIGPTHRIAARMYRHYRLVAGAGIADLVIPVSAYTFGNEADSESCEMHP